MPRPLRPLVILGCTSSAGKSLVATALARWFVRQGVDVAPFKAQNMSNNARVVDGGEIGVAQWLQAGAARIEPSTDLNPVLLKPEADDRSQVVVDGRPRPDISEVPWRQRGPLLWPHMTGAFDRLHEQHDLVIIEGAGSPAEINLPDLVNNRMLEYADGRALLVSDIDRGGAFAHLFGTWSLVPDTTRLRLGGFVLNRFRGDAALLEPAPTQLSELTSMPSAGVLPMLHHELPDEEGGTVRSQAPEGAAAVAIVRYPFASNLDEFHLLARAADVRWATTPSDIADADLVILPGSKHVAADAAWLRASGLGPAIIARARDGQRTLGICGGAMLVGEEIADPEGIEGAAPGLALLALRTTMRPDKVTRRTKLTFGDQLPSPWNALSGREAAGYEIRNGQVSGASCQLGPQLWGAGAVLATTVHGFLEDPEVVEALVGHRPEPVLESTFELLADAIDDHLDTALLWDLVRPG